jgi:hypothetical protein
MYYPLLPSSMGERDSYIIDGCLPSNSFINLSATLEYFRITITILTVEF